MYDEDEEEERDEIVRIEANGRNGDEFVVLIKKKVLEHGKTSKDGVSGSKTQPITIEALEHIYNVRKDCCKIVRDANDYGALKSVESLAAFRDVEAANQHVRGLVEEEIKRNDQLDWKEITIEDPTGQMLRMDVYDLVGREHLVYEVMKQRLWVASPSLVGQYSERRHAPNGHGSDHIPRRLALTLCF